MQRTSLPLLAAAAVALGTSPYDPVQACSSEELSVYQELDYSGLIFSGRVVESTISENKGVLDSPISTLLSR